MCRLRPGSGLQGRFLEVPHALHHWHARGRWLKERKRWHALHHRRGEWPACYGVTTSFWDRLFGSVQTVPSGTGRTRRVVNRTDPDGPFV